MHGAHVQTATGAACSLSCCTAATCMRPPCLQLTNELADLALFTEGGDLLESTESEQCC